MNHRFISILFAICVTSFQVFSQADETDERQDLGKKTQNPLADLVIVPLQNTFIFHSSQNRETGHFLNIQPVFPIHAKKISFINRVIISLGYIPGLYQGGDNLPSNFPDDGRIDGVWGLGDLNFTSWITPKPKGSFSWGIGPSVSFPIATDNRLGTGKWSIGPSMVVVWQPAKWTIDVIVRQLWSVRGDIDRYNVNQFFLQPLVAYNLNKGWALATMPVITANWDYDQENIWLVPVGGGFNKLFFIKKLPILLMCHYYYNVVKPELAGSSELRIQFTFLFPR